MNFKIGLLSGTVLVASSLFAGDRTCFDFDWLFKYMSSDFEMASAAPMSTVGFKPVQLPHDWAIESDFLPNEPNETGKLPWNGNAWYVKTFEVPAKFSAARRRWFVDFDGVMQRPVVFVNGKKAGEWRYGYASFRVDISDCLKPGKNQIAVHVSNPPRSTRWYPGAGIYRNVWLEKCALVHIDYNGVYVTTPEISPGSAKIRVSTTVKNDGKELSERVVRTSVGNAVVKTRIRIPAGQSTVCVQELALAKPVLWSLENPYLYELKTEIVNSNDKTLDAKTTRFGVRTAEWKSDGFYLNGKRVPLNGVCEHHDLGCLGAAFYTRGYARKIKKLKEMGCNSIRMTHNPPAPEVLELCDRMGILVIDELFDIWKHQKVDKVWGYHRYWPEWWQKDVRNFVMRDRNHPSVIAWSGGNEVPENGTGCRDGRDVCRMLRAEFRKYDVTRPYTVGTNNPEGMHNGFSEEQDVFGFNYKPHLYAQFHGKYPNQPLYGSETCSAISSRDEYFFPFNWGQGSGNRNYQVSSYGQCAVPWGNVADQEWSKQELPYVCGEYVWTGFDYLGEPTPYNLDASNINNFNDLPPAEKSAMMKKLEQTAGKAPSRSSYFGLIDLAGFPKDNFYLYQSHWNAELPMAHILPHWNWPGREGQVTPIVVYSSGDEAELFVNGKSQGVRKRGDKSFGMFSQKGIAVGKNDYRFVWEEVKYEPGSVEVVVKKNGKPWATAKRVTTGPAVKVVATAIDRTILSDEGHDLAHIELALVDKDGNVVPTDCRKVSFTTKGASGRLIGFCNGNATDWTSMQNPEQRFYNGRILAVLRGERKTKGEVSVVVSASGLPTLVLQFTVK